MFSINQKYADDFLGSFSKWRNLKLWFYLFDVAVHQKILDFCVKSLTQKTDIECLDFWLFHDVVVVIAVAGGVAGVSDVVSVVVLDVCDLVAVVEDISDVISVVVLDVCDVVEYTSVVASVTEI